MCNRRHHGGPDKAVYAFAREDLDRWAQLLGTALPDGHFGENLTTAGLGVTVTDLFRALHGDADQQARLVDVPEVPHEARRRAGRLPTGRPPR